MKIKQFLRKIQLTTSTQSIQIYKSESIKCYNLGFDTKYNTSYNFLNEELLELIPAHTCAYVALKVFATRSPSTTDKPI